MPNPLFDIIARQIHQHGPMNLGEYMSLCLGHPQYGYYMTRDPLGAGGDFTTSPEISQMFGELIGAWIADAWDRLGRPSPFALVECGPGRGTLMEDALRATRSVPGFHDAMRLHLIEMSPVLKKAQEVRLNRYGPVWIKGVEGLPTDTPVILVGNEFLDALPIRQVRWNKGWFETTIGLAHNDTLGEGMVVAPQTLLDIVPPHILLQQSGEVFEVSPILNQFIRQLSNILKKQKGAALFIDYGHAISALGNTFQAVRSHRFESPFENPGESDLTAHVDFENVGHVAAGEGVFTTKVIPQGAFLKTLGIEIRAQALKATATPEQVSQIDSSLGRLTQDDQMGRLFKVIALCHDEISLAGF